MQVPAISKIISSVSFQMRPKRKMPPTVPTNPNTTIAQEPSFGYSNQLKTLWRKGKLPTVKKGFYGDELTPKNLSIEHLELHSEGGANDLTNTVLSSRSKNWERGNEPLSWHINFKAMGEYLEQFTDIVVDGFIGNLYKKNIIKKVNELLSRGK